MLPQLILSTDKKKVVQYIKELVADKKLSAADIFTYRKDPHVITIEQIREIDELFTHAYLQERMIIVYDFDTAKNETQNAFLKTLEERSASTQFILVASHGYNLLSTIVSRCVIKRFFASEQSVTPISLDKNLAVQFFHFTITKKKAQESVEFFDNLIEFFRQQWRATGSIAPNISYLLSSVKEIIITRQTMLQNNVSPQSAIDHLLIFFQKQSII